MRKKRIKPVLYRKGLQLLTFFLMLFSLTACDLLTDLGLFLDLNPIATTSPTPEETTSPEVEITETLMPSGPPDSLTIWLPPDMDPEDSANPASIVLQAQLEAFSSANADIEINIRIKAVNGPGGLLDALTSTQSAAPAALPDLIALPRKDLETAALKSLVYPIDSFTNIIDDSDWYAYAKELALIQASLFGIPFMGDALVLVSYPAPESTSRDSWEEIMFTNMSIAFAADDPQALFTLALYQGNAGPVQDGQRRPMLDEGVLTDVFRLFEDGAALGTFNPLSLQFQNEEQVWQAFENKEVDAAVVSLSMVLEKDISDILITEIPPISAESLSLASGWVFAVATQQPQRQELSVRLAETLVEPRFLSNWSQSAKFMPTRPSALQAWDDVKLSTILSQISLLCILRPPNDITASLSPLLRTATLQVLQGQVDPAQAARVAKENLQ